MNMRTQYFFSFLLSFVFFLISCSKDEVTENENTLEESEIPEEFKDSYLDTTIQVDGVNAADFYKDCFVNSIYDETPVLNGIMKLQSKINRKIQTYFLTDGNNSIYMLSRVSNTQQNKKIEFTVESTALAFVTLNPFFAQVDSVAYDILVEAILQSRNFPIVRTEVNNLIKQKKDLYNQHNTALHDALGLLLDELIVFADYKPEAESTSRAITNETGYYPFRLNSSGNRLDFQVFGLNPDYYGTATHANGSVEKLVVHSHEDFGFLNGLESILNVLAGGKWNDIQYGEISSYTFPDDGECQFHFSYQTVDGYWDLIDRLLASSSDILGLDFSDIEDKSEYVRNLYHAIESNDSYEFMMAIFPYYDIEDIMDDATEELINAATDVLEEGIEQSYDEEIAVYEKLKSTTNDKNIINAYNDRIKGLKKSKELYSKVMRQYSLIKGLGNAATRVIAACRAADPVNFKLCCYNDEIRNCSQIRKYKGDNQNGVYGVELDESISVMVNVNMESLSDYIVKFEVTKGGGSVGNSERTAEYVEISDNVASINWTLGSDSEEQIVRASLCEKSSKEEVCESVEFKATAEQELLSIYIENIEYKESPFHDKGIVTFEPTITVSTDETEKLENLYDWGLVIYKEDNSGMQQEIERIKVGKNFDSIDFTRKFELEKSDMDIDCTNFIAKNDDRYSIGTYVKYDINGRTLDSDVLVPIELVYNRKPEIRFTNAVVTYAGESGIEDKDGKDYPDYALNWEYTFTVDGTLFFDNNLVELHSPAHTTYPVWGTVNFQFTDEHENGGSSGSTYWDTTTPVWYYHLEGMLITKEKIKSVNKIKKTLRYPGGSVQVVN